MNDDHIDAVIPPQERAAFMAGCKAAGFALKNLLPESGSASGQLQLLHEKSVTVEPVGNAQSVIAFAATLPIVL